MTAYELMIKTNHYLIKGGELTAVQKRNIVRQLLAARSTRKQTKSFYNGIRYQNNIDSEGRRMYPEYFIPPYNDGKKLQTVVPMSPKTHILAANSYELEILRLLYIFAPNDSTVREMTDSTLERLKTTCFGYKNCSLGECFHSALITLRFLAAISNDTEWMKRLVDFYNNYSSEKSRHSGTIWYYWLCLSELPLDIAESEILKYKDEFFARLNKSYILNSEKDKINNPLCFYIPRNCLTRFHEFEYLLGRHPYVSEKDNRLHFETSLMLC